MKDGVANKKLLKFKDIDNYVYPMFPIEIKWSKPINIDYMDYSYSSIITQVEDRLKSFNEMNCLFNKMKDFIKKEINYIMKSVYFSKKRNIKKYVKDMKY